MTEPTPQNDTAREDLTGMGHMLERPDTVEPPSEAVETVEAVEDQPRMFDADYVKSLRAEAAEARVRAKRTDDANARLVTAFAKADGRLIDLDAIGLSDDLLDDDGLVDPARVGEAITGILAAKPFLTRRTPTTPIAQGLLGDVPDAPGLFDLIRGQA